ncbi:MAG: N-acetylglucosamine kinase-like BadF-type ATPase, partial [Myxococcota bacterium]
MSRQSVVVGVDGGSTKTRAVVVDRATGECIG